MKLHIENFAKIKNAELTIDGITVIAGENDTGKSTVGKVLFSFFNAMSDFENKIEKQRSSVIQNSIKSILHEVTPKDPNAQRITNDITMRTVKDIEALKKDDHLTKESLHESVKKYLLPAELDLPARDTEALNYLVDKITQKIQGIIELPDTTLSKEILTRYFMSVFNNQIQPLKYPDSEAKLRMEIKGYPFELLFRNNGCSHVSAETSIEHKAIYIDNPFVINKLNTPVFPFGLSGSDIIETHLLKLLKQQNSQDDMMDGIIESVLAKKKLSEIYSLIQSVVDGQIIQNPNKEFRLKREGVEQSFSLANLSTGLKSFVIIQRLLEDGAITEKDVLILDEPEIHLHPQWQLIYAELIVLLQKQFDLSVVVTTHSPYFLEAIDLFSQKHETDSKVNYYLSELDDDSVTMNDVTGSLEGIYRKMASPLGKLKELRYELNNA